MTDLPPTFAGAASAPESSYYSVCAVSNTSLGLLDPSCGGTPQKFKQFLDGKSSRPSPAQQLGTKVHAFFLDGYPALRWADDPDANLLGALEQAVDQHKKAYELLVHFEIHSGWYEANELEVFWDEEITIDGVTIKLPCKAKLDRLRWKTTGEYQVIDLKTTGSPVQSFPDAVKKYQYERQLLWYNIAAMNYLWQQGIHELAIPKLYLIALGTKSPEVAVYELDWIEERAASKELLLLTYRAAWHWHHNSYEYPMEYYTNDGVIPL